MIFRCDIEIMTSTILLVHYHQFCLTLTIFLFIFLVTLSCLVSLSSLSRCEKTQVTKSCFHGSIKVSLSCPYDLFGLQQVLFLRSRGYMWQKFLLGLYLVSRVTFSIFIFCRFSFTSFETPSVSKESKNLPCVFRVQNKKKFTILPVIVLNFEDKQFSVPGCMWSHLSVIES